MEYAVEYILEFKVTAWLYELYFQYTIIYARLPGTQTECKYLCKHEYSIYSIQLDSHAKVDIIIYSEDWNKMASI